MEEPGRGAPGRAEVHPLQHDDILAREVPGADDPSRAAEGHHDVAAHPGVAGCATVENQLGKPLSAVLNQVAVWPGSFSAPTRMRARLEFAARSVRRSWPCDAYPGER